MAGQSVEMMTPCCLACPSIKFRARLSVSRTSWQTSWIWGGRKVEQSLNRGLHPLDLLENDVQVFLTEGLIGQRIHCRLDQQFRRGERIPEFVCDASCQLPHSGEPVGQHRLATGLLELIHRLLIRVETSWTC